MENAEKKVQAKVNDKKQKGTKVVSKRLVMHYRNLIHITIFWLDFILSQVNFTTKLSKNRLGLNERVKVEFSVDKDGDNFIPPKFENFRVVGGPSQSIRNSWINGKRSYSKTYSYFLSPIEKGSFEIGQASIEVEGEIYKTLPVKVTVTSAVDKPTNPNDPNYLADKKIHLVAELSNKSPFINEAVSVTYKLYVSPDTGVDNWRELEAPRYANFWSNNIDIKSLMFKMEHIKVNHIDMWYCEELYYIHRRQAD